MEIYVVDVDGTLVDPAHHHHIVNKEVVSSADWDKFFDPKLVAKDRPRKRAIRAMKRLAERAKKIGRRTCAFTS